MKTLLILVFFGIVLFKLSNGQDHDIEKVENVFHKNELDVNIDEVADANAKKRHVQKKKKGKKRQSSKRRKKQGKKKRRQTKKLKRKQKKEQKKRNNRIKAQKKKRSKKRKSKNNTQKKEGSKKRQKRKRTLKKKGGKKQKNWRKKKALKKKKRKRNLAKRKGPCEEGCTDIFVQMMKESRRITTFLKQYNRIINGQKRADSKFSKKGNFDKDKDDSPLKLMLEAGGGNKSDMECAGSKQNPAAVLMKNITEKLDICAQKIAENCNKSMWSKIKPEWVKCNTSMIILTNLTNECMRKQGKTACDCFNKTAVKDGLKKIKTCNSTDMLKAANNDKKSKKSCIDTYANCRHVGEETRKVISVCAPGGPALEDITKHMGIAKKHHDTTLAIQEKVKTLMASRRYRIRKDRSVVISGTTYTLEACQDWVTACHKYFDELKNPTNDEVVDAGDTISSTTVTCSATDREKLKALFIRTEHMLRRLAHFIKHTGQKLEKISGSTVSVEHAVSIFVAGKPTKRPNSKYTTKTPVKPSIKPSGATSASSSVTTTGSSSSLDYCSISTDHTMCKYSGPSDECKANTVKRDLTDTEKKAILDKHNELRRKVAKGLETRGKPGPQPAASDMLLMVWDDELAAIAQRWADQCTFGHDAKRDTKDGYVGQNAAISSSSAEMSDAAIAGSYASATTSWYEEVNDPGFNKDSVSPFVFSSGIGHYTQVVWASSRAVGCGSVYYNSGSGSFPYNQLIICNYFTGGNLQGAAMYSLGAACSACPSGYPTCSDALCTV